MRDKMIDRELDGKGCKEQTNKKGQKKEGIEKPMIKQWGHCIKKWENKENYQKLMIWKVHSIWNQRQKKLP